MPFSFKNWPAILMELKNHNPEGPALISPHRGVIESLIAFGWNAGILGQKSERGFFLRLSKYPFIL
jgi:hypothetical protein